MRTKEILFFSLIMIFLEMIIFREFLFGDLYFIFKDLGSDSYVNDYPALVTRIIAAKQNFLIGWSFHNGLGENIYPYSFEPISWILFRISNTSAESVMLILPLIYIYLSGLMMFIFFSEHKIHFYAKISGSLLWAFSGYFLLACSWSVSLFSPYAFHFSFLLFALERAASGKQYFWLAIVFAIIGISYPVNLFFAIIIFVIYFIIKFYLINHGSDFPKRILSSIIYIFLGIGASSWMLLSSLNLMLQSPRAIGKVSAFESQPQWLAGKGELISTIYRLFSPNLLGDAAHFSAYRNYFEAPLLCCGLLTVLLLSQVYLLEKRGRIVALAAISIVTLIYLSPLLRSFVWLRSGDYYRILNLFFVLILIIISTFILSKIVNKGKLYIRPLLITASLSTIVLVYGFIDIKVEGSSSFFIPVIFIWIFTLLLTFRNRFPLNRLSVFFLLLISVELIINSSHTIGQRGICDQNDITVKGYQDSSSKSISKIYKQDSLFFRLEKDFYSGVSWLASYNEAKIQNYYSSSVYNSFNNSNYINFLKTFGIIKPNNEPETRFVTGIRNSPYLMKLCSVKYFLTSKSDNENLSKIGFDEIENTGNFRVLKDDNFLPFGFCYDKILGIKDFNSHSKENKEQLSLQTLVIEHADSSDFERSDFISQPVILKSTEENITDRKKNILSINEFRDNHISGTISLNQKRFLFLSMPFDEGWKAFDNSKSIKLYKAFGGLTFLVLMKGKHHIKLKYSPPFKDVGIWISAVSFFSILLLIFFQFKKTKTNA
ncbi:YfhO family protein [Chryseobacterium sp. KACC 21268]|nr:YfhO family protein [Chryseobacterium sp. KACC 21268]